MTTSATPADHRRARRPHDLRRLRDSHPADRPLTHPHRRRHLPPHVNGPPASPSASPPDSSPAATTCTSSAPSVAHRGAGHGDRDDRGSADDRCTGFPAYRFLRTTGSLRLPWRVEALRPHGCSTRSARRRAHPVAHHHRPRTRARGAQARHPRRRDQPRDGREHPRLHDTPDFLDRISSSSRGPTPSARSR